MDTLFGKIANIRLTLLDASFNTVAIDPNCVAATIGLLATMTIRRNGLKTPFFSGNQHEVNGKLLASS
jgi:uncharacterized protein (AIM24 family)